MKLKITTYPNKILRTKLDDIEIFDIEKLQEIIKEMTRIMKKYDGIGLAANQVGLNTKIIVIEFNDKTMEFINPKITSKSLLKQESSEGCLSFPKISGIVNRPKNLQIQYQDIEGKKHKIKVSGLYATVFEHEIDHINGIIFTDKIKKFIEGEILFKKLQSQAKKDER
ncbi:MAG: peptide deformylase [Patescibacteria group bacterium]|nr:peptide deformylase [Patescibacteria group bacterium]MDD4304572.1 peptide deformylase [Patescibacteria group bacterium]MDD4695607.1 peptide deformylase [Patescibacteria group bacterium]